MRKASAGDLMRRREGKKPARAAEEPPWRWQPQGLFALFAAVVTVTLLVITSSFSSDWFLKGKPLFNATAGDAAAAQERFLMKNSKCTVPELNPFGKQVLPFWKKVHQITCSHSLPLTTLGKNFFREDTYVLRIEEAVLSDFVRKGHNISCCFSNITRFTPAGGKFGLEADDLYNVSECINFKNEVDLKPEEEFILVRCIASKNGTKTRPRTVYTNMHSAVRIKPSIRNILKERETHKDENKLNVLILCYDSMSHLNLLRTMPKTVNFLKKMDFFNFPGYTKVGENTFPNAFGLLTGLAVSQAKETCFNKTITRNKAMNGVIDDCPFIWNDFRKENYVTGYFDDALTIGARTVKTTFVKQPTDYYIRPYMLASQRYLPVKTMFRRSVCIGPVSCTDRVLDYVMQFAATFKKYFFFSVAWLGNFSHNDINLPGAMDLRTRSFFEELGLYNIYNNTVVLFMSDHGMRYGNIRSTMQGWYEERMPFLYISLPTWFKKKYGTVVKNLQSNEHQLVSTYDVFVTLKDILNIATNKMQEKDNISAACPKCRSLISDTIEDRKCEDAGIPDQFCICTHYEELPIQISPVVKGAKYALDIIREKIKQHPNCSKLELRRVVKSQYNKQIQTSHSLIFLITFETYPGGGLFQSVIKHNSTNDTFSTVGIIQRINSIGDDGECVSDEELKLYCHCN